jgi:hypothetical protein
LDTGLTPFNRASNYRHKTAADLIGFRQKLDNQYHSIKNYKGPKIRQKVVTCKNVNSLNKNFTNESDIFMSKSMLEDQSKSAENYTDRLNLMNISEQRQFKLRLINRQVTKPNIKSLRLNRKYRSDIRKGSRTVTKSFDNSKPKDRTFMTKRSDFEHL